MIARRDLLRSAERWSGCLFVRGRTKWAKIKSIKVFMEFYERQEPLAMGVWPLTSSVLPAKSLPCFVPFFSVFLSSYVPCSSFSIMISFFIVTLYCTHSTALYGDSFVRFCERSADVIQHDVWCIVACCWILMDFGIIFEIEKGWHRGKYRDYLVSVEVNTIEELRVLVVLLLFFIKFYVYCYANFVITFSITETYRNRE